MRRSALLALMLSACSPRADVQSAAWQPKSGNAERSDIESFGSTQVQDAPPAPPATTTTPPPPADELPASLANRLAPPAYSDCTNGDSAPLQTEDEAKINGGVGLTKKVERLGERKGGLDKAFLKLPHDSVSLGYRLDPIRNFRANGAYAAGDTDGDCLADVDEAKLGTDPNNPDSDGDGWFDGLCNERRKLIAEKVVVHESQDWSLFGGDDFYLVADDVRFPSNGLDDYVNALSSGDSKTLDYTLATRTRGVKAVSLAKVNVEGWDDDFEIFNTWTVDDLLFTESVDLGGFTDGQTFTKRYKTSDYDYEVTFRVDVERFADPNPLLDGDSDKDGIRESAEAKVAADFGGVTDPERADVLVEVDWMKGHRLRTEAKRQVVSRLQQHGVQLFVWRDEEVPLDNCLSVGDAKGYYKKYFTNVDYDAFRYAIVGEQIWNDASGVTWGDIFLVDDSTWWISDMVLPQAGTFIHELGHTLSLTKQDTFHLIDSISWISYDSAMNYTFQALMVDYGNEANDDLHHNDWADVKPGHALKWSFALVGSDEKGICK